MDTDWWDRAHEALWRISGHPNVRDRMRTARRVARDVAADAVARGGRLRHRWTPEKAHVLQALDDAGLTSMGAGSSGGLLMGLGAAMWELAWVDAGAAVCCLSGSLAQGIVRDAGTAEQREKYLDSPALRHGAVCLTEPAPGAGADASTLDGRIRVTEWEPGAEPLLEVEKRGRFTSHMDFAEFVVAAVESDDQRLRGSCAVILEPSDKGLFDRGAAVGKLGHQLSSTTNPEFRLRIPASRIVGGYTVENETIVPNVNHREGLAPAFRRARAAMALVTSAKVLSAVEAVTQSQGGERDFEWQSQLLDVWAAGEAAASLGFSAVRLCDRIDDGGAERGGLESQAAVVCPAAKLFSTSITSEMLRKAAALMGEHGTLLGDKLLADKLMDAQVEAVYLGPEAIQRGQIAAFMIDEAFQARFLGWTFEMHGLFRRTPGARTAAAAMELWSWTAGTLGRSAWSRQSVAFPMADALSWLLATRSLMLDAWALQSSGEPEAVANFYLDLATIQSIHAAGSVAQICSGLLFGCAPEVGLPEGTRVAFAALRSKVYATFSALPTARGRASEFLRAQFHPGIIE